MKIEIAGKKENVLQERIEVDFKIDHPGEATPTRDAMKSKLADAFNVPKERVIIDNTDTDYGRTGSKGYAKIYGSVEAAKRWESKHILVRNGLLEKEKKVKKEKKARPAGGGSQKK
ncbi:MAG: 30S ribosomal protein S24e [Euryarchaeota archaeon]|nr:30S ribosomal protein S24e [Euryarchaeota archaeon]